MAKLTASRMLLPFMDAILVGPERPAYAVELGLAARVSQDLCRACDDHAADLARHLETVIEEFASERSCEAYWGKPSHQKQLLKELANGRDARVVLDAMAPEFSIELSKYLIPSDAEWVLNPVGEPVEVIARVRRAARKLWLDYIPKRGRANDFALETAVRALIRMIEPLIGHFPEVSGNKNNGGRGPTPRCAGARAIEQLLRPTDRQLTTTAIMNMISKVRRQPQPSQSPLMTLVDCNEINALMCCLGRGAEEAIAQLQNDPFNGFAERACC